jgi:LemA protein
LEVDVSKYKNWIIIGCIVILIFILMGFYNGLVSMREEVKSAWAQVDNQLQRRNDLIPNYVRTVQGYAKHEKEIFQSIADARSRLMGAKTINDKIQADTALSSSLSRLLLIVENYPNLKANENFMRLQDELAGTENRIAVERKRYNDTVMDYNKKVQVFPRNLMAKLFHFEKADYYKIEETARTAPKVEF